MMDEMQLLYHLRYDFRQFALNLREIKQQRRSENFARQLLHK